MGALFIGWLWMTRDQRIEILLLGVAAWFFLADLFVPAYRNSYNDVLILNVAALGIIAVPTFLRASWVCLLLALPLGWIIYVVAPTQAWLIDLPSLFFTLGASLFLVASLSFPKYQKRSS